MLAALNIQPGGWGKAPGDVDMVQIRDIVADNVATPLMATLNENNNCGTLSVERMTATQVYGAPVSIESWKGGVFENIKMKDVSIGFVGADDPSLVSLPIGPPPADYRQLPCWAFFAKNVKMLELENVSFSFAGTEYRPAFLLEDVDQKIFNQVIY